MLKSLKFGGVSRVKNPRRSRYIKTSPEASGELALDSCPCQAAGTMNSYLLAVSGVTHAFCACNQSEFDVVTMVVVVVKNFHYCARPHHHTKQRILDAKTTRLLTT